MEALARRPPLPLPSRRAAGWRRLSPQRPTHETRRPSLATRRDARALRCPCQPGDAQRRRSTATASSHQALDASRATPPSARSEPRRNRCVAATDDNRPYLVLASTATCAALPASARNGAFAICPDALDQRKRPAVGAPRRVPRRTVSIAARTASRRDAQRLQRSACMRADASITAVEGDFAPDAVPML